MTNPTTQQTRFSFRAPDAQQVFLAGTFNEWKADGTPMEKSDTGNWSAELELLPGRYEFKFVVDGQWCCEANCDESSECPQCVPNGLGTMNRVIEVA